MTKFFTMKRIVILAAIMIIGFILGRMAVRMFINLIVGGSLSGGNFL